MAVEGVRAHLRAIRDSLSARTDAGGCRRADADADYVADAAWFQDYDWAGNGRQPPAVYRQGQVSVNDLMIVLKEGRDVHL